MGATDEFKSLFSAFAYIAVLVSFFLTGLLFVLLAIPLLYSWNSREWSLDGILMLWGSQWSGFFAKNSSTSALFTYTLLVFLVGFTLQPLATVVVNGSGWLFFSLTGRARRLIRRSRAPGAGERKLYGLSALSSDYAVFADWLQVQPNAKSVWEWEFFNYYLASGMALNGLLLFFTLAAHALFRCYFSWALAPALIFTLYTFMHAWTRSLVLSNLHEMYMNKAKKAAEEEKS